MFSFPRYKLAISYPSPQILTISPYLYLGNNKNDAKKNCIKLMSTFQSEDASYGKTCARCRPNHTVNLQLHHLETNLRIPSADEGPLTCGSERVSVDKRCMQETKFRGKSVRMAKANAVK